MRTREREGELRARARAPSHGVPAPRARGGLLGLQRTIGNRAVTRLVQRVVYTSIDAALTGILGGPLPGGLDPSLRALVAEADALLAGGIVDFQAAPGSTRPAAIGRAPAAAAPPVQWVMTYNAAWPGQNYLIATFLHEVLHATMGQHYTGPAVSGNPYLNMQLPAGLAGAALGTEITNQMLVLDANLEDAEHVVGNDATLAGPVRAHILERLRYGRGMPDVHYDTVLADILAYMQLLGLPRTSAGFLFVRRLVRESTDRRRVAPWTGIKRARRVRRNAPWYAFWEW
jgi:hypothetical protein